MKSYLLIFILTSAFSKAQIGFSPPPKEPTNEQIEIVERFIKNTNYQESLKNFLASTLRKYYFDYKKEDLIEIYDNFDFNKFKSRSSIYHLFDEFSKEEIQKIENIYSKNKFLKGSGTIFITPEITNQIDSYVEAEIKKYQKK